MPQLALVGPIGGKYYCQPQVQGVAATNIGWGGLFQWRKTVPGLFYWRPTMLEFLRLLFVLFVLNPLLLSLSEEAKAYIDDFLLP